MTAAERRAAPLVFHLIPHTHWDREWYLGAAAFGARLVTVLDDLLARLERDPAWRTFLLDGQTILLEDYLAVRPEQEPLVRRLAGAGRLQVGPWYVLADELIPSGESLVRNLLLGTRDAARWGGDGGLLRALYSPDMFGHPAALPALAGEFGIARGALWRGLDPARAGGRDLVRWAAPDGGPVLLYHLPRDGYEVGAALPADPAALARAWPPLRESLVGRAATPHVAVFVGADHHAAHPELPALRRALAELEPGSDVRISRLDEFLEAAEHHASHSPELELRTVRGELRDTGAHTWSLQGVHSTRAPQKRRNADLELLLERAAEPLAALAAAHGGRDERPLLRHTWRQLVACHFHDAIAGCASDEVARAVDARFDRVAGAAGEVVRRALFSLAGHDPDRARGNPRATVPSLVLWNPAARRRAGIVIADVTRFVRDVRVGPPPPGGGPAAGAGDRRPPAGAFALRTADGGLVPVQVLDRVPALERLDATRHYPDLDEVERVRVAFEAPEVAPLGLARLELAPAQAALPRRELRRSGRTLANRFVEVMVEPHGALTLTDRITGERYEGLLAWEAEDDAGDLYTPSPAPGAGVTHPAGGARVRDLADGPLMAALEVRVALVAGRAAAGDGAGWVDVRMVVMLFADDPAVRVRIELVNAGRDHRLRARFPVGLAGRPVLAGSAFAVVGRGPDGRSTTEPAPRPDAPAAVRETALPTAPAHRFVAAADGARGVALFAPGFFEYEWTTEGDLLFTALRAAGLLSREDLPTRPGHAGWTMPTPDAQCLGEHRFDLALVPTGSAALERPDELLALWEDCFLPLRPVWLRMGAIEGGAYGERGIELDGTGLVLSAVKPAEEGDGIVLRCWNALDRPTSGTWRVGWDLRDALRTRADERDGEPLAFAADRRSVRFTAAAHEIVTIIVR